MVAPFRQAYAPYCRQITRHIQRTIGESAMVFHELLPSGIQLDIHVIPPGTTERSIDYPFGRHFFTLVTSGLSAMRMKPQQSAATTAGHLHFTELMLSLPASWKGFHADGTLDSVAMEKDEHAWPLRWLKEIVRLPLEEGTSLHTGDTLPRAGQGAPLGDKTAFSHLMIHRSRLYPSSRALMVHDDIEIQFQALWPLYPEEQEYKQRQGSGALIADLRREGVTDLVDVARQPVRTHAHRM